MSDHPHRTPYVGAGQSGAWRSAEIDRSELDTLSFSDPRYDDLQDSLQRWEAQARDLMHSQLGAVRPPLAFVARHTRNEISIGGLALVRLSHALRQDLEHFTGWSTSGTWRPIVDVDGEPGREFDPDPYVDWDAWIDDVDANGRGWSTTEYRLFELTASLTSTLDRGVPITHMGRLGSWQDEVWKVIKDWADERIGPDYLGSRGVGREAPVAKGNVVQFPEPPQAQPPPATPTL